MHSLKIRPATVKDVPSIVKIRKETVTEEDIIEFAVPQDKI